MTEELLCIDSCGGRADQVHFSGLNILFSRRFHGKEDEKDPGPKSNNQSSV